MAYVRTCAHNVYIQTRREHLRRAVGARLHIRGEVIRDVAGGAKVNNFDLAA